MAAKKKSASERTLGLFTGTTDEEEVQRLKDDEVSVRKEKFKGSNVTKDVTWFLARPPKDNPNILVTMAKSNDCVVINISTTSVPGSTNHEDIVASKTIAFTVPEYLAIKRAFQW